MQVSYNLNGDNMKLFKKIINIFSVILITAFITAIIASPQPCKEGAINGILICGKVIIPSLYPFTVCVLFIIKSGVLQRLDFFSPVTNKLFGITAEQFLIMLLSFIGGFPVGAKLINEYIKAKKLTPQQGAVMLNYCINAGPAFIIGAIGVGIIGSNKIGYILLASHIAASVLLCFLSRFFKVEKTTVTPILTPKISPADNFVLAATESAVSVFNICAFIILFSAVNAYLKAISVHLGAFKYLLYVTEVTNAITYTDNILLVSFLLGFSGICIWCQVLSAAKTFKPNLILFIVFRLLHGIFSMILTYLLLKVFPVTLPTFSSNHSFSLSLLYSTPALTVSMLSMSIIFLISLNAKKYKGKILEDII